MARHTSRWRACASSELIKRPLQWTIPRLHDIPRNGREQLKHSLSYSRFFFLFYTHTHSHSLFLFCLDPWTRKERSSGRMSRRTKTVRNGRIFEYPGSPGFFIPHSATCIKASKRRRFPVQLIRSRCAFFPWYSYFTKLQGLHSYSTALRPWSRMGVEVAEGQQGENATKKAVLCPRMQEIGAA